MKLLKLFTLLLLMSYVAEMHSQTGQTQYFNYKAIIKDDNGNVLANTQITVKLSIIRQILMATSYSETHTPTTDENGIINLTIGQGNATQGNWETINWSVLSHYLNVKIDIGNGLRDMGTTIFRSVPYAIHAQTSDVALNTSLKEIHNNGKTGWRLRSEDAANHGNIGNYALDFSISHYASNTRGATGDYSMAVGLHTKSSGDYSFVTGYNTRSFGDYSVGMGSGSRATGDYSVAIGINNQAIGNYSVALGALADSRGVGSVAIGNGGIADGDYSTAFGYFTNALGKYSTSLGYYTNAFSLNSLAIGRFNIGGGNSTNWLRTNKLFEIGNGTDTTFPIHRSNAFTVFVGTDASLANNSGFVMIGNDFEKNILFDTNEIMARNNGHASTLYLNQNGGAVAVNGAIVHASDRRLKRDIENLKFGLKEILAIHSKQYNWKKTPNQKYKSLGVIAQEIQTIIPNLVHVSDDEKKSLSVNYTALIPVLIKAIQEQQKIIESQDNKVNVLSKKVTNYKNLEARLSQLESVLNIENNTVKAN